MWLTSLVVVLPACDDHVIGQGIPIRAACLRDPPLTYDNFGDGMISRQCRPCHGALVRGGQRGGAPIGVDFDNEQDVLDWADAILRVAVEQESMPPAGGMLPRERELLAEYMRCDVLPRLGQVDLVGTGEDP